MTTTVVNGAAAETEAAAAEPTCLKTPGCPRPAGHSGICKGQKMKTRRSSKDSPEHERAENKSYGRGPKATPAQNGRKPQPASALMATATAAVIDPGYFKIEFEDKEDTISREGHGREGFARALKALYQEFAGVSNG
jgi:hypothetical protein